MGKLELLQNKFKTYRTSQANRKLNYPGKNHGMASQDTAHSHDHSYSKLNDS